MVQTTTNYQEASQFLHPFWPSWYASNWPVSYSQTLTVYPTLRHNSWLNLSTQCPRLIKWQAGTHRSGTEDDGTLRDPCKTRMNWPGDAQQAEATPYLGKQLLGIQLGVLGHYLGDKAFKGRNRGHSRSHWGVCGCAKSEYIWIYPTSCGQPKSACFLDTFLLTQKSLGYLL